MWPFHKNHFNTYIYFDISKWKKHKFGIITRIISEELIRFSVPFDSVKVIIF